MARIEGRRPVGIPRRRWEDNIERYHPEVSTRWREVAQDGGHMAGACECGNELLVSIKCGEFFFLTSCGTVSF